MTIRRHLVVLSTLGVALAISLPGSAQTSLISSAIPQSQLTAYNVPLQHQVATWSSLTAGPGWELAPLVDFNSSEIKFNLQTLMNTLRDNRHEGWVLAAYPDPKTSRPLIGAGFSLDLPARAHAQRDPLNPNSFLEPSSAQLWEAAGLSPQQLQTMLQDFNRELDTWNKKKFRRKIRTHELFPQMNEEDATKLLRIYAIQAVHNARAYCRNFDQLTGPQQMALAQMVYQMGVNLEEFTNFLSAINSSPQFDSVPGGQNSYANAEYWNSVQGTLVHTDWARRYSTRAISVMAMFDPTYDSDPYGAEARVRAEVRPLVYHTHKKHRAATVRTASLTHKKSSAHRTRKS
jgi:hypothetical protein